MKTTTRAVLLFGLVALAATQIKAEGPSFNSPNGWTPPGSNTGNTNPYPDPNSNNNDNGDNNNSTDNSSNGNGDENNSGSGSESGSGNGLGNGSGGYGGGYGGGYEGGFGNNGGGGSSSSSPFGPELNGLNDSLEYASLVSYRVAHGAIASLSFVFLFPLGAILLRVAPNKAGFRSHWVIQVIATVLYVIAAGLGLYLLSIIRIPSGAGLLDIMRGNAHPIIGIVLLVALAIQPLFGVLHHRQFKKLNKRTWASHVHLWLGRLGITLGIINGGLGLALAGSTKGAPVVAYAIISVIMWSLWVMATVFRHFKDRSARNEKEVSEVLAKIIQEDDEYLARRRNNGGAGGSGAAAAPPIDVPRNRSYDVVPDGPSPPYEPGPDYERHMAHANQQRQQQFGRGELQSIKEVMDASDNVSIISASQDEMRRGQV